MSRRSAPPPASSSSAPSYTDIPAGDPSKWSVRDLKGFLKQVPSCDIEGITEKQELIDLAKQYLPASPEDDDNDNNSGADAQAAATIPEDRTQRTAAQWASIKFKSNDATSDKDIQYLRSHTAEKGAQLLTDIFTELIFNGPPITMNQVPHAVGFTRAISTFGGVSIIDLLTSEDGCGGGACGKSLSTTDIVYRCLQCAADPTCIMCSECFFKSPCVNHPYKMSRAGGGMCDCGDPTAWEAGSFCSKHKVPAEGDAAPPTLSDMLSPEELAWVPTALRGTSGVLGHILYSMVEIQESVKTVGDGLIATVASTLIKSMLACASASPAGRKAVLDAMIYPWSATPSSPDRPIALLDELVRFDMSRILKRDSPQEDDLRALFRIVVIEPESKMEVIRSLVRFAERKSPKSRKDRMNSLDSEAVQVLTVPWAATDAMDPAKLRLGDGNTVLHRLLSGVLYGLSKSCTNSPYPTEASEDPHFGVKDSIDYPVLRVKEAEGVFDEMRTLLYNMKYAINSSRDVVGRMMVLSRVLLSALCIALEPAHFLGWVRRTDDAVDKYAFETMDLCLVLSQSVMGELGIVWGRLLQSLPSGEGTSTSLSSSILEEKYLDVIRNTNYFPQPPDGVTSWFFKSVLDRCSVWKVQQGADSLLLSNATILADGITTATTPLIPFGSRLELVWATSAQILHSLAIIAYAQGTYGAGSVEPSRTLRRRIPGGEGEDGEGAAMELKSRCLLRGASFTNSQPLFRILGVLIHRFLAADSKDPTISNPTISNRRLRTILPDTAYVVGTTAVSLHHILDLFVFMRVAASQIHNQLWRRDYFSCLRTQQVYDHMLINRIKEVDHFMFQCIVASIDPWDVSVQMLDRFSYLPVLEAAASTAGKKKKSADSFYNSEAIPMGYGSYLANILGLVGDAVQSCTDRKETLRLRILAIMAPRPPMLTSEIIEALGKAEDDVTSVRQGEALERENEVETILAEVSTSERSKKGTTRRIKKDKALWATIPPYSLRWDLNTRHEAIESYTLSFPPPLNNSSSSSAQAPPYPYTVSEFPCPAIGHHNIALEAPLRALLHSPMSVSTALFVILQRALQCRYDVLPSDALESNWGNNGHREEVGFSTSIKQCKFATTGHSPQIEGAIKHAPPAYLEVNEEDLLTAIDYLLLVLQDAKTIAKTNTKKSSSSVLRHDEGDEEATGVSGGEGLVVAEEEEEDTGVVNWGAYREYLRTIQSTFHTTSTSTCYSYAETFGLCPIDWGGCKKASDILDSTTSGGPLVCLPDLAHEEINSFVFQVNGDDGRKPQPFTAPTPPTPCEAGHCDVSSWFEPGGFSTVSATRALELYFSFALKEHSSEGESVGSPSCSKEVASIYATKLKEITSILRNEPRGTSDGDAAALAEGAARDAASAAERLAKIKEKQKLLAERMRKKQAKASAAHGMDSTAPSSTTSTGASSKASPTSMDINLHEGVVMHGASLECCFCRAGDEDGEALMYLAHAASSNHMTSIVHGADRDITTGAVLAEGEDNLPQRLNATVMLCGHAAHATCFSKHFAFLQSQRGSSVRALLMARRGYRGMHYLGGAEIVCPLCSRVCSALSSIPRLAPEAAPPVAALPTTSPNSTTMASILCDLTAATKDALNKQSTTTTHPLREGCLPEWVSTNMPLPHSFISELEQFMSSTTPDVNSLSKTLGESYLSSRRLIQHVVGPLGGLCSNTISGLSYSSDHRALREHSMDTIKEALTRLITTNIASTGSIPGPAVTTAKGLMEASWVLADGLRTVSEGLLKVGGGSPTATPNDTIRAMQPATKSLLTVLTGLSTNGTAAAGADFQNRYLTALLTILVSLPCVIVGDMLPRATTAQPRHLSSTLSAAVTGLTQFFTSTSSGSIGEKRAREEVAEEERNIETTTKTTDAAKSISQLRSTLGSSYQLLDAVELASLSTVLSIVEGIVAGIEVDLIALTECGDKLATLLVAAKTSGWSQEDRSALAVPIDAELRGMLRGSMTKCLENTLGGLYNNNTSGNVGGGLGLIGRAVAASPHASGQWSSAAPLAILRACVTGAPVQPQSPTTTTLSSEHPLLLAVATTPTSTEELAAKALSLISYTSHNSNKTTSSTAATTSDSLASKMIVSLVPTSDTSSIHRFVPYHLGEVSVEDILSLRRRDYVYLPQNYSTFSQLVDELKVCHHCSTAKVKGGLLCLRCKKLMCLRGSPPEFLAHVMDFDKAAPTPAATASAELPDNESSDSDTAGSVGGEDDDDNDAEPQQQPPSDATAATSSSQWVRPSDQCGCGSGGVGVTILPKVTALCVLLGNQERVAQLSSIYVDRYGEVDDMLKRGAPLTLSERFYVGDFLLPYIMNTWDHDTTFLQHAWRHNIQSL